MWENTVCSSAVTTVVAIRNIEVMCGMYSVYSICTVIHYLSTEIKYSKNRSASVVDCVWNVMAHAKKPDFVFRRNGRVHLNRRGHQLSRLLTAEVCASAVVMLDSPCSEVVWRVLATHFILQFPLHLPSRSSPCAITFQLASTPNVSNTKVGFCGVPLGTSCCFVPAALPVDV